MDRGRGRDQAVRVCCVRSSTVKRSEFTAVLRGAANPTKASGRGRLAGLDRVVSADEFVDLLLDTDDGRSGGIVV